MEQSGKTLVEDFYDMATGAPVDAVSTFAEFSLTPYFAKPTVQDEEEIKLRLSAAAKLLQGIARCDSGREDMRVRISLGRLVELSIRPREEAETPALRSIFSFRKFKQGDATALQREAGFAIQSFQIMGLNFSDREIAQEALATIIDVWNTETNREPPTAAPKPQPVMA